MAKFQAGTSGNPKGRAAGSKDRRTALRELLQPHAKSLIEKCVALAKAGDPTALRICMDRLVAPMRDEPVRFTLPTITRAEDCIPAQAAVLAAVAIGELTITQAAALSGLIEGLRKSHEVALLQDVAKRLEALEVAQRGGPGNWRAPLPPPAGSPP